jgi:hypothetical protein
MVRDYKWPGLYEPFNHQKTTAEFLSINRKAFCLIKIKTKKNIFNQICLIKNL